MAIELKNVSFAYPNGYVANENLNLTIEKGERIASVGQNGAGKTTAVKLMNGLNRPSGGDVLVDGVNTKEKSCAWISRKVGYVFQNPDDQIFNSTALAEIQYMPKYFKLPESEIKKRTDRAVELTGIGKYLTMNPLDIPYAYGSLWPSRPLSPRNRIILYWMSPQPARISGAMRRWSG